jgi:hypothetical protein
MAKRAPTKRPTQRQKKLPGASGETRDAARVEDWLASSLKHLEKKVKQGDAHALITAIDFCLRSGRPVPLFFAQNWCDRTLAWFNDQVETLDEALGVQRPKGQHFQELKKRSGLRPGIVLRVLYVKRTQNLPIGDEVFAIVGEQLGVTTRFVRDTWYAPESKAWRTLLKTAREIVIA